MKPIGFSYSSLTVHKLTGVAKKAPRAALDIFERSESASFYIVEFLYLVCAGPGSPSVCSAGRALTGSGKVKAFPWLLGSFANVRLFWSKTGQ